MKHESEYHSYLIRLWREGQAGEPGESSTWQGDIVHIQSGEKWPLHDLGDVLAVLKATMKIRESREET